MRPVANSIVKSGKTACSRCKKRFPPRLLRWHRRDFYLCPPPSEKRPSVAAFRCPGCSRVFPAIVDFQRHHDSGCVGRERQSSSGHNCPECSQTFSGRSFLLKHLSHCSKSELKCPNCPYTCSRSSELLKHASNPNGCSQQRRLLKNWSLTHGRDCPSQRCSFASDDAALLGAHLDASPNCLLAYPPGTKRQKQPNQLLKLSDRCPRCQRSFANRVALRSHVTCSASCGSRRNDFKCQKCPYTTSSLGILSRHKVNSTSCLVQRRMLKNWLLTQSTDCKSCGFDGSGPGGLGAHLSSSNGCLLSYPPGFQRPHALRGVTGKMEGSVRSCPQCQAQFTTRVALRNHVTTSASCGSRRHKVKCKSCPYATATHGALAEHLAKVNGCATQRRMLLNWLLSQGTDCKNCDFAGTKARELPVHLESSPACLLEYPAGVQRPQALRSAAGNLAKAGGECPTCLRSYGRRDALHAHLTLSATCGSKRNQLKCPSCPYSSSGRAVMARHRQNEKACEIHRSVLRNWMLTQGTDCKSCGYNGDGSGGLMTHLSQSQGCLLSYPPGHQPGVVSGKSNTSTTDQSTCPRCQRRLADRRSLLSHLHHGCGDDRERQFKCRSCPFAGVTRRSLANHCKARTACEYQRSMLCNWMLAQGEGCTSCGLSDANGAALLTHLSHSPDCLLNYPPGALPLRSTRVKVKNQEEGVIAKEDEAESQRVVKPALPRSLGKAVCASCPSQFGRGSELRKHLKSGGAGCRLSRQRAAIALVSSGTRECRSCSVVFPESRQLLMHLRASIPCAASLPLP